MFNDLIYLPVAYLSVCLSSTSKKWEKYFSKNLYNLGYYFTFRLSGPVFRKSDLIMNKAAETEATQVKYHLRTANKGGLQIVQCHSISV